MDALEPIINGLLESISSKDIADEQTRKDTENGISLLALKNEALLAYIHDLLLLAAAQLEQDEETFESARSRAIEQRITLEKGVKGLEAKISYQVDKALRAYRRSLEEVEQAEQARRNAAAAADADSDEDEDLTSYRPNVSSMNKAGSRSRAADNDDDDGLDDEDKKRYVVPKISANAPAFENSKREAPRRRDFAMEEYIRETGDAPRAEPSIGSQIMDGGRGGERTERDRRRDREVEDYEEANFTRISNVSSKRARKDAFKRQRDAQTKSFFGEDWGFLDELNGNKNGKSKKRKTKR